MKKRFNLTRWWTVVLLVGCWSISVSCSSKDDVDLINSAASAGVAVGAYSGFTGAYPQAQAVNWTALGSDLWEARFTQGTTPMAALLRTNGSIVDRGQVLTATGLPTGIQTYLTNYPGNTVQTVFTGENGAAYRVLIQESGVWRHLLFGANSQLLGNTVL